MQAFDTQYLFNSYADGNRSLCPNGRRNFCAKNLFRTFDTHKFPDKHLASASFPNSVKRSSEAVGKLCETFIPDVGHSARSSPDGNSTQRLGRG
ncbi:hypothetical protein EVAR_86237_1 [Eumeta japonica]|uniref:Uncharacterized protein n=1 Tax=Eumeta variegata TaxID=151549 RepID=A0A4C1UCK3_EUMVA|nr:hypothetical protein EVAR_86237_1 [Eumeta japonica]